MKERGLASKGPPVLGELGEVLLSVVLREELLDDLVGIIDTTGLITAVETKAKRCRTK